MSTSAIAVMRIYLPRRRLRAGRGFWAKIFPQNLSRYLAEEALRSGVIYASVSLGHVGFVQGAKGISEDVSEAPPMTLPTCLELVGDRATLEDFARRNIEDLRGSTIALFEGVEVRL